MAKIRKRGRRRGKLDLNNNDNSPGNEQDRNDDGINNSIDNLPFHRGRGGLRGSTTNSRRKDRGGRKHKNSKPSFIENPFQNLEAMESWYQEPEYPEPVYSPADWQQPDDNQYDDYQGQGYDDNSCHHHHHHHSTAQRGGIPRRGRGGGWIRTPSPNPEHHSGSGSSQLNKRSSPNFRGRGRGRGRGGHLSSAAPPLSPSSPPLHASFSPPSSSADEELIRARFCTECSAVRRANLTLRDWFSNGIEHASDVLDSWSDEVGVDQWSADEMDWQPEPVVRVLILPSTSTPTPASTPPPSIASDHGSNAVPPGDGERAGGGGSVSASCMIGSPWGLRPSAVGPEFSNDDKPGESGGRGEGGGKMHATSYSSLFKECASQPMNNTIGPQNGGLTPPDTPPPSQI